MTIGCFIHLRTPTVIRPTPYRHTQRPQVREATGEIKINAIECRPSHFGHAGDVPLARTQTGRFEVCPDGARLGDERVSKMRIAVKRNVLVGIIVQSRTQTNIDQFQKSTVFYPEGLGAIACRQ